MRATGARLADPTDPDAAELLATVKRASFGDREPAALAGVEEHPRRAPGTRAHARLRDGRHAGRGVRRRDAVSLRDARVVRLGAGGRAGPVARACRHRQRPADRAGHRVRLLRGPGAADVRRGRGGDGQLQPRDGIHRLRRVHPPYRAARPGERAPGHPRRDGRRVRALAGGRRVRRADPAEPRRSAVARRRPAKARTSRPSTSAEERTRFAALLDRLHPAARGRDGREHRRGAGIGGPDRLPGHRPAVVRHRRARRSTSRTRPRTSSGTSPRLPSSTPTGRCGSTSISKASRSTSTRSATGVVPIPGLAGARRARGRPLGRLDRGLPAPARHRVGRSRMSTMERVRLAPATGLLNAQFIVRDDGVYLDRGQPARRGPCRSCPRSPACPWSSWRSASRSAPRSTTWAAAGCDRRRPDRGEGAGVRRPSSASTRRWGRTCSRPARSSTPRTRGSRWPRR